MQSLSSGNGELKHLKRDNPALIIGMRLYDTTGACSKNNQSKYRYVDIVFGTHNTYKLRDSDVP